mmetsp:Transcript_16996/g.35018  ORF Transcript_16996/g.35018 Transcript_16996/m.35018 type:complete len:170 (+) Transcript_16996:124-633(+)
MVPQISQFTTMYCRRIHHKLITPSLTLYIASRWSTSGRVSLMVTAAQKMALTQELEWQPSEVRLMKPNQAHNLLDQRVTRPAKLEPYSAEELTAFVDKLPPPPVRSPPPQPPGFGELKPLDLTQSKYIEVIDSNNGEKLGLFTSMDEAELVAKFYRRKKNANIEIRQAE